VLFWTAVSLTRIGALPLNPDGGLSFPDSFVPMQESWIRLLSLEFFTMQIVRAPVASTSMHTPVFEILQNSLEVEGVQN